MADPITAAGARDAAASVRDAMQAADVVAANGPEFAGLADEVIHALRERPIRRFDLRPAVAVAGLAVRPLVRLRIDSSVWVITCIEAAALSVIIRCGDRCGSRMRDAELIADGFALAGRTAFARADTLIRFGVAADVHGAAA